MSRANCPSRPPRSGDNKPPPIAISKSLNARQKTTSTSGSARSSYRMLLHGKREEPLYGDPCHQVRDRLPDSKSCTGTSDGVKWASKHACRSFRKIYCEDYLFNAQSTLSIYHGNYSAMKPIKVLKSDIGHADLPGIGFTNINR